MKADVKHALILGQSKLLIQAAEYLLSRGWNIKLIVSLDNKVIEWANLHAISCQIEPNLTNITVTETYLFSISWQSKIPEHFLSRNKIILALNYHDSLLPRYAGVNSTTWSILNQEQNHGVTIHKISERYDEGDIAIQSLVPIDANETALSLNIKCAAKFLQIFQETIISLEKGSLNFFSQNREHRSYYSLKDIPNNYAIINGVTDSSYLSRLSRSLNFGSEYANSVATVKLALGDRFYILEEYFEDSAQINPQLFGKVRDIYGNSTNLGIRWEQVAEPFTLQSSELDYLVDLKRSELKNRDSILEFLLTKQSLLEILPSSVSQPSNRFVKSIYLPSNIDKPSLLSLIYIVIARYFDEGHICLLYHSDSKIPKSLRGLVDSISLLDITKTRLSLQFADLRECLENLHSKPITIVKDFGYRYKLSLLTDIAIVIGKTDFINQHKMILSLENDQLIVMSSSAYQLQVESILKSIQTLILEYLTGQIQSKNLETVNLLDHNDYQKIIFDWNNTSYDYQNTKTIFQVFEDKVNKNPLNIAIIYNDSYLTYSELNQKSNQLAYLLRQKYTIKPDDLILICMGRSQDMVIALLGVLKSGAAYVPLDPLIPSERLDYILTDTQAKIIITDKQYHERFNLINSINILVLDDMSLQKQLRLQPSTNQNSCSANNLAYVIYTSGTTGRPKGVLIEHRNVVNLIASQVDYIFNKSNHIYKCSWFASYTFDAHVWELYVTLAIGGEVHILNESCRKNVTELSQYINDKQIEVATLPPAILTGLPTLNLQTLILAGEKASPNVVDHYHRGGVRVINAYGPTEDTVCTCLHIYETGDSYTNIGRPLYNKQVYILDHNLQPLPLGALGELYISGDGLARGYLNLPDYTRKYFVANPFLKSQPINNSGNSFLYKTGDRVRYLANGCIEYVSRTDSQIKLRRYRIELAEIESHLASYPGIRQAIVESRVIDSNKLDFNSSANYLVGYYVADIPLDEQEIYAFLAERLPTYMLPTALVSLKEIPLTLNGKLNRKLLPEPDRSSRQLVEPRNYVEQIICKGFAQVLDIAMIGIDDDFFQLGGNSILAIKLVTTLQQDLEVNINQVFQLKTPRKLAIEAAVINNNLFNKLNIIKQLFPKVDHIKKQYMLNANYNNEFLSYPLLNNSGLKQLRTVLLTGATGYLGCHILFILLQETNYKIYLLVRGDNDNCAYSRLRERFYYYFQKDLDIYIKRIKLFAANLEENNLGLTVDNYRELTWEIDSIIHCAALVKHYGSDQVFYAANVQATLNLLELAKLTKIKDFHYISTIGIFMDGYVPGHEYFQFDEESDDSVIQSKTSIYTKTKSEAEKLVIRYRNMGVNTNIYRIGNLFLNATTHLLQENFSENAFYVSLETILTLGLIPTELIAVEISPVDYTAKAIIKLFDQQALTNQTFHVFNPKLVNLYLLLSELKQLNIKEVSINQFIDSISGHLKTKQNPKLVAQLELFLVHKKWLQNVDFNQYTVVDIKQSKTNSILFKLGFEWPIITSKMLSKAISLICEDKKTMKSA